MYGKICKNRISGTPVIDENRTFPNVFSRKWSMQIFFDAAYYQLSSNEVWACTDHDAQLISLETDWLARAQSLPADGFLDLMKWDNSLAR